ncbi:hypothetical protein BJ171DRAFT_549752 [Polychytrium aggregatum]|nr:hypothetical protein BJ171DRAFT_549717 [Polychytrium aggregatum]KAI9188556.1 hypothetical protein BJ171DRAFT_549752 [Polychytrium aggregatum]
MNQHLLWCLYKRIFRRLNSTFGSSRIASSAYQKWPTRSSHSKPRFTQVTKASYIFKV